MTARQVSEIDWATWKAVEPATLVFVIEGGRVLLIRKKRGLGAGKINGPGGRLEPGEQPELCAARELYEELGVRAGPLVLMGHHRFQFIGRILDVVLRKMPLAHQTGLIAALLQHPREGLPVGGKAHGVARISGLARNAPTLFKIGAMASLRNDAA